MNDWDHEPAADEVAAEIHKRALPRESNPSPRTWQRFLSGAGNFYRLYIRGWTWEQIDRLREAKLREFETGNLERTANAMQKLAEAKKLDAEAESIFYELEAKQSQRGPGLHKQTPQREPTEEDWEELKAAIEVIRLKGGVIQFPSLAEDAHDSLPPLLPNPEKAE